MPDMKERLSLGILMVGTAVAFLLYGTSLLGAEQDSSSERNAAAVFDRLLPLVYSSGKPVRLYYRGACPSRAGDPVPFPLVQVRPASKDKTGLAAVREIFKNDRNVTVMEDSTGIIRIRIGKVPAAILQTKLSRLNLTPAAQYNPGALFDAILDT